MSGENNKTLWEIMAFLPLMFLLSAFIVGLFIPFPGIANMSLFGVVAYVVFFILFFLIYVSFLVHVFRNECLDKDKRIQWLLYIFFANVIVYPIYWWTYIRTTPFQRWCFRFDIDPEDILNGKLNAFEECGIKLSKEFSSQVLIYSWGEEAFNTADFEFLLLALGGEEEEEPWRSICTNVWLFDTECIVSNGDYIKIAKRIMEMTQGSLLLEDIKDSVDYDNESAWLSFVFQGRQHRINCEFDNDWADTSIFKKFAELLTTSDPSKQLVFLNTGGQDCLLACIRNEHQNSLCKMGIEFQPVMQGV